MSARVPSNGEVFGVLAFAFGIGFLFRSFLAALIALAIAILLKEI